MKLPGFSWTQLGAFVAAGYNLGDTHLDRFAQAGGRWVVPVIYGDDDNAPWNVANLRNLQNRCEVRGMRLGAWVNCVGQDPRLIAQEAGDIIKRFALAPVVLDAEAAYQGNTKMSSLLQAFRETFPLGSKAIAVSTNSLNDSVVYNGRRIGTLAPGDKSFRAWNVHVLPQWYNSPNYSGCWTDPVCNMQWLQNNGATDNFYTPDFPDHRSVDNKMVHPTLETTGLEDADLRGELESCLRAQKYGFRSGISIYKLENAPDADFVKLRTYRGVLFS